MNQHDTRALQVVQAAQQAEDVSLAILFGSRARGDYKADSDIDVLVVCQASARAGEIERACRERAEAAAQGLYPLPVSVDVVPVSASVFEIARHGRNHVVAHAVNDGVTHMGLRYQPPTDENLPKPEESMRLESKERAWHAVGHFDTLRVLRTVDMSEAQVISYAHAAQQALEHALKAVIAAQGKMFKRTHGLEELFQAAEAVGPDLKLIPPLAHPSQFAGSDIYGSPRLHIEVEELHERVHADLTTMFALIEARLGFDPWKVQRTDFQF